jgi:hypothetical protein
MSFGTIWGGERGGERGGKGEIEIHMVILKYSNIYDII